MQCSCEQCTSNYDEIDPLTGEQSGVCKQKKVPSPCARCETCSCSYPADSWLSAITRTIVEGVSRGVYLGCEGGFNSSTCTSILDDLPAPMTFDCTTGVCLSKDEPPPPEVTVARRSVDLFGQWTTVAILAVFLVFIASLLVLVAIAVSTLCARRRKKRAAMDMPGAPLAAIAAAQAALGGFGSNPPGATLVFSWRNVNCMRNGKQVLNDVSGAIESSSSGRGSLVMLLGPSGSGKTTLLQALAGRMSSSDSGTICINGKVMSPAERCRHVSLVYQDEILGATLTVREALEFSAALRLRALSASQRAGRVTWALKMLKLEAVADSRIGDTLRRGVSGGERRRVAIGVELVVSPPIMVLDEPTTGLDASCALMLGRVLARLAKGGRLLICSMHQPRHELLKLFDARLELGKCGDEAQQLCQATSFLSEDEAANERKPSNPTENSDCGLSDPALAEITRAMSRHTNSSNRVLCSVGHDNMKRALSIASRATAGVAPANMALQVFALWERSAREATRGSYGGLVAAVVVAAIAVLVGLTFSDLEHGVAGVQNRFGSIFFTQLFFSFFGLQACTLWYLDRDRLDRERASRLYHVLAYFIAKACAYLWWYCLIVPAIYVAIVYPLIGFQASISKFMVFYLCTAGTTAAASAVSLLCLSMSSSFASGMSSAAICLTVLQMYAGFLQRRDAIPSAFRWITDVSPFAHAFAAMISSEFTGLETTVEATGHEAVTIDGGIWPQQFNVDPSNMEHSIQMLGIVACSAWLLALVPIWMRWYRVKQYNCCFRYCRPTAGNLAVARSKVTEAPSWVSARMKGSAALVWKDLRATLPNGSQLYDGMNGCVQMGRPLAVLGPSGCGKTTLLSCLAGEETGTTCVGTVYLNRQYIDRSKLRHTVGYVRQDDALHPELTVREAISFAVALRMPYASRSVRRERVSWAITRLGLEAVANSKVGGHKFRGISGGERRRTAVGVELAVARGVLALDEPTSGLDSDSALDLGRLLSELASEGCIVLASMHQPSPELLAVFSQTLVLAAHGQVAYYGPTQSLQSYVDRVREIHPEHMIGSASDVLLDIISSPQGYDVCTRFRRSPDMQAMQKTIDAVLSSTSEDEREVKAATTPPVHVQMFQLLLREVRIQRSLAIYTYFEAALAGLLLGATYYQMSMRLAGVISRLGLIFAVHCTLGMQALQGLLAWREGYTSFKRERAAGYYYTGTYVFAKVFVDALLLRAGPPALMCLFVYWLGWHAAREGGSVRPGLLLGILCGLHFLFGIGRHSPEIRSCSARSSADDPPFFAGGWATSGNPE